MKTTIILVAALAIIFSSSVVVASSYKWCYKWKSEYVDTNNEAVFNETGDIYREARYSKGRVIHDATGNVIWSGTLDSDGCTPVLSVVANELYKVSAGTAQENGDKKIYFSLASPVGTTPYPASWIWWNYYFTAGQTYGWTVTVPLNANWSSPQANLSPVGGRLIEKRTELGLKDGNWIRVNINDDCDGTYNKGSGIGSICIDPDYGGLDHAKSKFTLAHEIGHSLSDMNSGPDPLLGGNYSTNPYLNSNAVSGTAACNCNHVDVDPDDTQELLRWHCLQSREVIGVAQGEGYAHFVAANFFNNRSATTDSCSFSYVKKTYLKVNGNAVVQAPFTEQNCNTYHQWMDTFCNPYNANMGTEIDWLVFFWKTYDYNNTSNRWDPVEFNEVFENVSTLTNYGWKWDDLDDYVFNNFPSGMSYSWSSIGENARVNHTSTP